MRTRLWLGPVGLALCAALVGCGQDSSVTSTVQSPSPTLAEVIHPLDEIPGLGVSSDAALRDETLALYEAWRRDTLVAECLSKSGVSWTPEALFPVEELPEIALSLNQSPIANDDPWPEELNFEMRKALGPKEREVYADAMYGETAKDIADWQESGGSVPDGRDPETFAIGGCSHVGWKQMPGVWQIKDRLGDQISALRAGARETDSFLAGQAKYSVCARDLGYPNINSPADFDKLILAGDNSNSLAEAIAACSGLWAKANEAGLAEIQAHFRVANAAFIEPWIAYYAKFWDELRSDKTFLVFLSEQAGRAQRSH
jgi:hypothetical protein